MTIDFYNCTDDRNKINKTLLDSFTIEDVFLKDNNVNELTPLLFIKSDIKNYNYCFIRELNKYYFIDNISIENNNINRIQLKIDVLMTYKNIIYNSHLNIIKCETNFINNEKAQAEKKDIIELSKINIDTSHIFNDNHLILVCKK